MADPVSFAASVTAIASLAGTIVIKASAYLRAVKSCNNDVRRLFAEVSLLRGVLQSLELLVPKFQDTGKHETGDFTFDTASDDERSASDNEALAPPAFIHDCQITLCEIEDALDEFWGSPASQSSSRSRRSDFSLSRLRKMDMKKLKWPMEQSKTHQLIKVLGRYKATCSLALAGKGIAGIHEVLEQAKISNKILADLRAQQEHFLELSVTRSEEISLKWLSSVNPASKLQVFRRERQRGTGEWLFELQEMKSWLDKPNSALWIYGIPGAGKTLLSTMVVDEVLNNLRHEAIGTAYFYVRNDDPESQRASNVVGSLIAQLARQTPLALARVKDLHAQHNNPQNLATTPELDELLDVFFALCRLFGHVYIMIDGLDECGSPLDSDRRSLIESVAALHHNCHSSVCILVFSREADDIKTKLDKAHFETVSIAATSKDVRLFVNAWLPSLNIQSNLLKIQIADTLVNETQGMFMWVRAQIDYLQRLPTDQQKKAALKTLPPDLPRTYIRIFETIDSTYPVQTTHYIQRSLQWIMFGANGLFFSSLPYSCADVFRIGATPQWSPLDADGPTDADVLRWLGCLVRHDTCAEFSHYTVREFLRMDPDDPAIRTSPARKYLVGEDNEGFITNNSLKYLLHPDFATINDMDSLKSFSFVYKFIASLLETRLMSSVDDGADNEGGQLIRTFFATPTCHAFKLWNKCKAEGKQLLDRRVLEWFESQLRVAITLNMKNQVRLLLEHGMEPDKEDSVNMTPLHQAIVHGPRRNGIYFDGFQDPIGISMWADGPERPGLEDETKPPFSYSPPSPKLETQLAIIQRLVDYGANINRQIVLKTGFHAPNLREEQSAATVMTPLTLAITIYNTDVAVLLVNAGANCDIIADQDAQGRDYCAVNTVLSRYPHYERTIQEIIELSGNDDLRRVLQDWKSFKEEVRQLRLFYKTTTGSLYKRTLSLDMRPSSTTMPVDEVSTERKPIHHPCNLCADALAIDMIRPPSAPTILTPGKFTTRRGSNFYDLG
ncbi:MAG: hypothetical protein Q9220_006372 [cf. Caloplaca sp. 1 TL-2023]